MLKRVGMKMYGKHSAHDIYIIVETGKSHLPNLKNFSP